MRIQKFPTSIVPLPSNQVIVSGTLVSEVSIDFFGAPRLRSCV
jgi:hypothetical protein